MCINLIGDIIFIRTNSPISWLIQKLTRSTWSHCGIICSNNFIIEADIFKPVKGRKMEYSDFKVVPLNIADSERLQLISYLLEQTNEKYNYKRICGLLFYLLNFTRNRDLWSEYNKVICCQLITRGLSILDDVNIPQGVVDAITPAELASILLKEDVINKSR